MPPFPVPPPAVAAVSVARTDQPAANCIPIELWRELRSDHAGEAGAVCIYRGILALSRDPHVRAFAERHLATEQSHLTEIERWLPASRRSRLLPAWRVAGWITGALPSLFGARAVFGTIEEVESFVDRHYAQQLELIDSLPPDPCRAQLRSLLASCQADEVHHRDEAAEHGGGGRPSMLLRLWCRVVGAGSAQAVKVARRL